MGCGKGAKRNNKLLTAKGVGMLLEGVSQLFLPRQTGGVFVRPLAEGAAQAGRQPYA